MDLEVAGVEFAASGVSEVPVAVAVLVAWVFVIVAPVVASVLVVLVLVSLAVLVVVTEVSVLVDLPVVVLAASLVEVAISEQKFSHCVKVGSN